MFQLLVQGMSNLLARIGSREEPVSPPRKRRRLTKVADNHNNGGSLLERIGVTSWLDPKLSTRIGGLVEEDEMAAEVQEEKMNADSEECRRILLPLVLAVAKRRDGAVLDHQELTNRVENALTDQVCASLAGSLKDTKSQLEEKSATGVVLAPEFTKFLEKLFEPKAAPTEPRAMSNSSTVRALEQFLNNPENCKAVLQSLQPPVEQSSGIPIPFQSTDFLDPASNPRRDSTASIDSRPRGRSPRAERRLDSSSHPDFRRPSSNPRRRRPPKHGWSRVTPPRRRSPMTPPRRGSLTPPRRRFSATRFRTPSRSPPPRRRESPSRNGRKRSRDPWPSRSPASRRSISSRCTPPPRISTPDSSRGRPNGYSPQNAGSRETLKRKRDLSPASPPVPFSSPVRSKPKVAFPFEKKRDSPNGYIGDLSPEGPVRLPKEPRSATKPKVAFPFKKKPPTPEDLHVSDEDGDIPMSYEEVPEPLPASPSYLIPTPRIGEMPPEPGDIPARPVTPEPSSSPAILTMSLPFKRKSGASPNVMLEQDMDISPPSSPARGIPNLSAQQPYSKRRRKSASPSTSAAARWTSPASVTNPQAPAPSLQLAATSLQSPARSPAQLVQSPAPSLRSQTPILQPQVASPRSPAARLPSQAPEDENLSSDALLSPISLARELSLLSDIPRPSVERASPTAEASLMVEERRMVEESLMAEESPIAEEKRLAEAQERLMVEQSPINIAEESLGASDATSPNLPSSNDIPGLWSIQPASSIPQILDWSFEIDPSTADSWNLDNHNAERPRLLVQLILTDSVKDAALGPDNTPAAIWATRSRWPPKGSLIVQINPSETWGGTWFPDDMASDPDSPSALDISSTIRRGKNIVRCIQLSGLQSTFIIQASECQRPDDCKLLELLHCRSTSSNQPPDPLFEINVQ
ncbi:hypothetical protein C8J56DRAFT_885982 [Mycena floridula]|nr:hypothetical protein C8J56DRAFT_885982 [Mycena floridula]